MSRKNKTVNNLGKVWEHIDNALSELNLAYEDLYQMSLKDDGLLSLKQDLERFDETQLIVIKNHLEKMIEEKDSTFFTVNKPK